MAALRKAGEVTPIWDFLNQPLIVTVVAFLLGGVLASVISIAMQRKGQRHSLRLEEARQITIAYYDYIRFLRRADTVDDLDRFDRLHIEMMSKARISRVVFGEEVGEALGQLAYQMQNTQNLRRQGKSTAAGSQLLTIYEDAQKLTEMMFRQLR